MSQVPRIDTSKTCNRLDDGKSCGKPSVYQIGFSFRPIDGRPPITAQTSLGTCEAHKAELRVEDLVSEDMKLAAQAIMRGLGGVVDPSSYALVFTPLQ